MTTSHIATEELLKVIKAQHEAMDWLLARLITLDPKFRPSQSPVWPAVVAGSDALKNAP